MAITGAIFNSLIYGGINSADYGVYISGDAVFNAPQRAVELVSVPGRNGSIAIDQGHFENIEVEYPAGMFGDDKTDFRQRLSDFRNAIMSKKGYQRLSDTYHPDEYRMGMYIEGLEVEPTHYNEAGQFTLKFNCKPQRYLTSGEQLVDIEDWTDVVTVRNDEGEPVEFDNDNPAKSFKSIEENFLVASQDGTPWKSEVESAPYLFRQSSGGTVEHDYNSESDTIVGGTVAWNQLLRELSFTYWSAEGMSGQSFADNAFSGTATAQYGQFYTQYSYRVPFVQNHKYLIAYERKADASSPYRVYFNSSGISPFGTDLTNQWEVEATIRPATATGFAIVGFYDAHTSDWQKIYIRNFQIIDLTALFGSSTIADYLLSLEQTTAGSGIAKLKEWGFNIDSYHAYDAGSLQSVNVSAHETVGFNQWDEEWEVGGIDLNTGANKASTTQARSKNYIPIFADTTYYCKSESAICAFFYDADKNYLGYKASSIRNTAFTPKNLENAASNGNTFENAHYMRIRYNGTTYNNDICINISSDRNGDYEPYIKHSYPLDSDLTLRGIPKLDASNNLYYDGDVYEPSGSVTRNFGIRAYQSGDESLADAITDGTNTVYRLSTPTTETAGPFTPIQDVSPYGTEQYIDYGVSQGTRDIAVPVGHQTRYIERVPIEGIDSITTYLGNTNSVEDATAYETEFNGTEYGGMLDVISGDFTRYFKGITYTGQDIGDTWISDCEPFVAGTLPTYGAQVVYFLSTFETDDFDGHDIDTLVGHNVLWSDPTSIMLEAQYGIEPGILYNPTRFDAQPLLLIDGYGLVEFNGYEIELDEGYLGPVYIVDHNDDQIRDYTFSRSFIGYLDGIPYNNGDEITATSVHVRVRYEFNPSDTPTNFQIISTSGVTVLSSRMYQVSLSRWAAEVEAILPDAHLRAIGNTATQMGSCMIYYEAGGTEHYKEISPLIEYLESAEHDWRRLNISIGNDGTWASYVATGLNVTIYSTVQMLGDPTYVDCELGECYRIDNKVVTSLNSHIDLGSKLPRLAPGINKIETSAYITGLRVRPRWWKI